MHPTLFAFIVLTSRLSGSADVAEAGGWLERVTCAVSRLSASANLFCRTMSSRAMVSPSVVSDAGGAAASGRLRAVSAAAGEARARTPLAAAERIARTVAAGAVSRATGARGHAGAVRGDRDEPPAGAVSAVSRGTDTRHVLRGGDARGMRDRSCCGCWACRRATTRCWRRSRSVSCGRGMGRRDTC